MRSSTSVMGGVWFLLFLAISLSLWVLRSLYILINAFLVCFVVGIVRVMVIVEAVAAGYQFIQLCKSCIKANQSGFHKSLAWLDFFLDQASNKYTN